VGRDTSSDQSGDQAAWRDLVARLELQPAIDPLHAPWPDRENLTPLAPDSPDEHGGPPPESGKPSPANRSRVIRPASFLPFAVPDCQPLPADESPAAWRADQLRWHAGRPEPEAHSAGQEAFDTDADLDFPEDDAPDDDEGYVPPCVPPQPRLDPVARGAWTALFGGPGYLFIATTLGWAVPKWAQLAAIIAFVAGFVILISRLGDGPSRRDGPDQGAVV
jgi:hypothetical protein